MAPKKAETATHPETHQVLYRKYRPHTWDEVIGQDHIVAPLKLAATSGKLAHAYLFTGPRGTGKTTVARIFAKALEISDSDIYEIDAASNRKIEDVRDLRENVRTLPFDSKYKIYILDEVHMMTKEAFNALLKTLEEPPAHTLFILATTELDRVPDTIVSRCQVFQFKKPSDVILREVVIDIAAKEGVKIDESGADLIALLGDGSYRDTEGVLDKVLKSTTKKSVTVEDIEVITGAPSRAFVYKILKAVNAHDLQTALATVGEAEKQNADMRLFMKLLIQLFRLALIIRVAPKYQALLAEASETDKRELGALVSDPKTVITSANLQKLLAAYQHTRESFIQSLPLELALIDILVPQP